MSLTENEKHRIEQRCMPVIEEFKSQYISDNPDKKDNYLVDLYLNWYRNYLNFCAKYKSEMEDRIKDEFEIRFVRLKIKGNNKVDFSYMRYTGNWHKVTGDISLEDSLEMIRGVPNFHPLP